VEAEHAAVPAGAGVCAAAGVALAAPTTTGSGPADVEATASQGHGGSGAGATVTFPPPVVSPHTLTKALTAAVAAAPGPVSVGFPLPAGFVPAPASVAAPPRHGAVAFMHPAHALYAAHQLPLLHYPYAMLMHPAAGGGGGGPAGPGMPAMPAHGILVGPAAGAPHAHGRLHVAWDRGVESPRANSQPPAPAASGHRRRRPWGDVNAAGAGDAASVEGAVGSKRPRHVSPDPAAAGVGAPPSQPDAGANRAGGGSSAGGSGGVRGSRAYMSRSSTSASSAPSGSEIVSDGEEWEDRRHRRRHHRHADGKPAGATAAPQADPATSAPTAGDPHSSPALHGHSIAVSGGSNSNSGAGRDGSSEREGEGEESVGSGRAGKGGSGRAGGVHASRAVSEGDAASSVGVRSAGARPDPLQPAVGKAGGRSAPAAAAAAADGSSDAETESEPEDGGHGGGGGASASAGVEDGDESAFMQAMAQRMLEASAQLSARDRHLGGGTGGGDGAEAATLAAPRAVTSRAAELRKVCTLDPGRGGGGGGWRGIPPLPSMRPSQVAEFRQLVESGAVKLHLGDVSRCMHAFVNPARPVAYFEKVRPASPRQGRGRRTRPAPTLRLCPARCAMRKSPVIACASSLLHAAPCIIADTAVSQHPHTPTRPLHNPLHARRSCPRRASTSGGRTCCCRGALARSRRPGAACGRASG
jgi:hypothetical protein